MDHPYDDLQSFALGTLERDEMRAIEAHVATCDTCAADLGGAEATVAAMLELEFAGAEISQTALERIAQLRGDTHVPPTMTTQRRSSRIIVIALAIAASFALATGGFAIRDVHLADALQSDGSLMDRMIASHFVHAQFRSPSGDELDAKVVYERNGRWFEILATGIDESYHVAVIPAGNAKPMVRPERFARRGDAFALALPAIGDIEALELRDGSGRVVGRVRIPK